MAPKSINPIPSGTDPEADRWNYRPENGVPLNPLFSWPPDPRAVWNWYRGAWLMITSVSICFLVALLVYLLALPPLEQMQTLQFGWILRIWLINVGIQTFFAGGLHWFLYIRKGQGMYKKFDKRDLARSNGIFTFNNQVWDNIWWTLGSGMTIATAYQVLIYWIMANGWVWTMTWADSPVLFVVWMFFVPTWSSFHFYWAHRLEHHPKLYKHVHAVHHRNINTGPWTGVSNHWWENVIYYTSYFVHLVIPSHPMHVLFHTYIQQVSPVFSHSGFERLARNENDVAKAGDFFHQLHHRYFECNYGTSEIPLDRWFGTYHDGTAEGTARTRAFKKQMYTK